MNEFTFLIFHPQSSNPLQRPKSTPSQYTDPPQFTHIKTYHSEIRERQLLRLLRTVFSISIHRIIDSEETAAAAEEMEEEDSSNNSHLKRLHQQSLKFSQPISQRPLLLPPPPPLRLLLPPPPPPPLPFIQ